VKWDVASSAGQKRDDPGFGAAQWPLVPGGEQRQDRQNDQQADRGQGQISLGLPFVRFVHRLALVCWLKLLLLNPVRGA